MPVVGGFKHALVSDGTGLNVDNSPPADVRFGSKADMCSAQADVRLVPKADYGELLLEVSHCSALAHLNALPVHCRFQSLTMVSFHPLIPSLLLLSHAVD